MDLINIALVIAIGITLFFGFSIFTHNRDARGSLFTTVFSLLAFNLTLWTIAFLIFRLVTTTESAFLATRVLYIVPLFIPLLFLQFATVFTKIRFTKLQKFFVLAVPTITTSTLILLTAIGDTIVLDVKIPLIGEKELYFGKYYFLYVFHYIFFFGMAYFLLAKRYFFTKETLERKQIRTLFFGTLITSSIGLTTNLIFPWFEYYTFNWTANFMSVFFIAFILYAIMQFKLFNLRIIAIELFIVVILTLLGVQISFFQTTIELVIKIIIFISIALLSFFLVRSAYREVEHREEIERLATDLKHANERLKELDKLKSEFVSIASHQLRSPLTAMKGYASLLLEGSYGKIPPAAIEAIENIFKSTDLMVDSVEDFLNVSRIEQGRMKYEMSEFDITDLAKGVFDEQKTVSDEQGVKLTFNGSEKINIEADVGKIKQVFTNLVDNAIKYSPKGNVVVSVISVDGKVRFSVKDTGIGMSKEDISKLFGRFSRANGANKVNVKGTGLGLYVAKQMVDSHKGKIWAESEGKGLGSTFIVELPISGVLKRS